MKFGAPALLLSLCAWPCTACGGKIATDTGAAPDAAAFMNPYADAGQCIGASQPPNALECTGLYANLVSKSVAPHVHEYAPAIALWADGSGKKRWIRLPPGTTIDASDPNECKFPVGTKVWKEFSRDGIRVETRLWEKTATNYWVHATYRWSSDETQATVSPGVDIPWSDGGIYRIPSGDECEQCHRGRSENILGFEQVLLGLPGATGLTLENLVADQRLRLDPTLLDGQPSSKFPTISTTLNRTADTPAWAGQTRIVPGHPEQTLLVKHISNRGTDNPVNNQMPPIATLYVDQPDTQMVVDWISAMPSP